MQLNDLVVEVRTAGLQRVGTIERDDLDIEVVPMFNDVGTWRVAIRRAHPMAEYLKELGAGIVVTVGDYVVMSGPSDSVVDSRSVDDDELLVVSGVSDDIYLADMLAWPDPTSADVAGQGYSKDVRTGTCEALMHAYVNANIGPSAPAARRVGKLSMGDNDNRGPVVTKRPRFRQLLDLLNDLAADGDLGFRIVQLGDGLSFETYRQRDQAGAVRLTINNGRLIERRVEKAAPEITRAIVAGKGKGKKRYTVMVDTDQTLEAEDDWGRRIETFIDQRAIDKQAELIRAGKEALVEGGFTAIGIQAVAAEDDGDMKFGRDWRLGDRVTIEVHNEERVVPVVGGVLRASDEGLTFGILLGEKHTASNIRFRPKRKRRRRHHDGGGKGGRGGKGHKRANPAAMERRLAALESSSEPRGRTGAIEMWAGPTVPDDALLCDGTTYNIEDYPALFAEIGATWGGNGTTTFAVPDLRNRYPVGAGSVKSFGQTDGKNEVDRTWQHTHAIAQQGAGAEWATPNTGGNMVPKASAYTVHDHGGATATSGLNAHPHAAINFIINT